MPWRALALGSCDPACLPFQLDLQDSWGVNRKCYQVDLNPCYGLDTSSNEEFNPCKTTISLHPLGEPEPLETGSVLWQGASGPASSPALLHPAGGWCLFPSGISGFPGWKINPHLNKCFLLGKQVEPANSRSGKCQGPSRESSGQGYGIGVYHAVLVSVSF